MKINTSDKWALFDEYAMRAAVAGQEWAAWNSAMMQTYGNENTDPGMIPGNVWPNWSDADRKRNRELLALFYDAQDKALKNRPHRVHMKTARNRLRSFLEF